MAKCKVCGEFNTKNKSNYCFECMETLIKQSKKENNWSLLNGELYGLCKKYPLHKRKQEIIAKILMIGRTYSATIERRKKKKEINDDFYEKAAQIILEKNVDNNIKINQKKDSLNESLRIHKYLQNIFEEISGLKKRSLTSKYLHFHYPDRFFIYDSRVSSIVSKLLKHFGINNRFPYENEFQIEIENYDEEYAKFYLKCIYLNKRIKEDHKTDLTCRELDNLLIRVANIYEREKLGKKKKDN